MFEQLMDRMGCLYLRLRGEARELLVGEQSEAGLSKLAITVILLAVAVGLTLAVVALIAPEILGLAEKTADQIESVPLDSWGQ